VWELTANAGELLPFEEGGGDPHLWMDPVRVVPALRSLADALADVDPENADAFRRRAESYEDELLTLDSELQATLDRIPESNRELVTSHDSLGYFADRFGFEVVATAFPASGAEAEPSAGALDEVADAIAERDVPAVFAGEEDDPEVLRQIADEAGVEVVDDLLIESPGSAGTYEAMLRHDAERIASALAP
jgi:ABC-type Zn uptake system ZnuABC Zn-binding protein ZnuA